MQGQGATATDPEWRLSVLSEAALALLAREGRWRAALAAQIAPKPHDVVLDGQCGGGALCITLARMEPRAEIVGLDTRAAVLRQARARATAAGLRISFVEADPRDAALSIGQRTPTHVVLTLTSRDGVSDRLAQLQVARQIIDPAGLLHVVDVGRRDGALTHSLRAAKNNADSGDLLTLLRTAGFVAVEETASWPTAAGVVSLWRGRAS